MNRRDKGITALCGGRAAIVPADAADDESMSDPAFRLYVKLLGHATPDGKCELNVKVYAALRGVTPRAVQKWKRELELCGHLVQLHKGDKTNGQYRVIRRPEDRLAAAADNRQKVAHRQRAKTARRTQPGAPANSHSHSRCEPQFALKNMSFKHDPPPGVPPKRNRRPPCPPRTNTARQGNRAGGETERQGHLIWGPSGLVGERAKQPERIDWQSVLDWIGRYHGGTAPWEYIFQRSRRISEILNILPEDAKRLLYEWVRESQRTHKPPDVVINSEIQKRRKAA